MPFPSPVGGLSLTGDYAPSVLFATLYGLLLPAFVYRLSNRRSRNILILGTFAFSIERLAIFSLRAAQTNDDDVDHWHSGVQTYMQITFGVTMAQDIIYLLRSLLVNTTYRSQDMPLKQPTLISEYDRSVDFVSQDQPRLRFWFRRYTDGAMFVYFLSLSSGAVAGGLYTTGMKSESVGRVVMILRHVSAALALLLVIMVGCAAILARRRVNLKERGASLICIHALLVATTCTYRLSVMYHCTGDISSTLPGSLNAPAEKAAFYVFHVLPEWMSAVLLVTVNVRREFGTGPFGDWRWRDETPTQKAKREIREQAKQLEERMTTQKRGDIVLEAAKTEKQSSKIDVSVQTVTGPAPSPRSTTASFFSKLHFEYQTGEGIVPHE